MISWPYAHLLINHFPVVLSVTGLAVALLALLLNRKGLWQGSMAALAVAGIFIFPVHFTGDKADDAMRDPWFVGRGMIEAHDKAATVAMYVILIVGVFAAYSWWRSVKRSGEAVPRWIRSGIVVGGLLATGTVTYTAYLGGKIIHDSAVLGMKEAPAGFPAALTAESRDSARLGAEAIRSVQAAPPGSVPSFPR
jgi:uncharacterized membrane protein